MKRTALLAILLALTTSNVDAFSSPGLPNRVEPPAG
jgi:hypothetical protein